MNKRNLFLTGLLVVQLALAAFLLWPRNTIVAASPLIGNVKLEDVNKLSIIEGDKTIQISKSGDKWSLPDRGDFEVLAPSVTDLISKVLQINSSRLVASNVANFSQLKVADNDFAKKVELTTGGGETIALLVGSSPNTRATNVRLAGDNNVYLTDKVSGADVRTDYSTYVNTSYFSADADRISALAFSNANGTLEGSKDISGTWQLAGLQSGESFSSTTFAGLPSKLINLSFTEPLGKEAKPEYGLDTPQATITMTVRPGAEVTDTTAAPEVVTLQIGAKSDSDSSYFVKSSKSDYYVKVSSFTLQDFVQKKREDYVAAAALAPLVAGESFTETVPLSEGAPITSTEVVTP